MCPTDSQGSGLGAIDEPPRAGPARPVRKRGLTHSRPICLFAARRPVPGGRHRAGGGPGGRNRGRPDRPGTGRAIACGADRGPRRALPQETLDRLPADGASQHDHYLYGTPKRPEGRSMAAVYYADTFWWIAAANPKDAWHARVLAWEAAHPSARFVTTEEILSELLTWFSATGPEPCPRQRQGA